MVLARCAVLVVLAGCFKPDPPSGLPCGTDLECPEGQKCSLGICGGSAIDPDAPIDVIDATTGCWAAWLSGAPTFDAPAPITVANSASSESNAELSEDQLTLYFERSNDVFASHRDDTVSPWQPPSKVPEFSTADVESKAAVAAGDSIAILSIAVGAGDFDLFQMERPAAGQPFANRSAAHFGSVNAVGVNDFDPELTADGLHLYFTPGGNTLKIATRTSPTADFGTPVPVPGISGVAADSSISPDERVIVYSTTNPGTGLDIVFATRTSATSAFGPVTSLSINSAQSDGDPELSADGCTLTFSSSRTGTVGGNDLWETKVK